MLEVGGEGGWVGIVGCMFEVGRGVHAHGGGLGGGCMLQVGGRVSAGGGGMLEVGSGRGVGGAC